MELKKDTLDLYKHRITLRKWISWEEYITLKVGDKLIMPKFYQDTDGIIGEKTIIIDKLWKNKSKDSWDYDIEHGCLSGRVIETYTDENGNNKVMEGCVCGTFSVNLDNVVEEKTIESERERFIKSAISYISNFGNVIDIEEYERYLRNL